jgi:hypothetical protein
MSLAALKSMEGVRSGMAKKGFKEGNARLDRMLQRPGTAERVAEIQERARDAENVKQATPPENEGPR